jgi:hypothetical protein
MASHRLEELAAMMGTLEREIDHSYACNGLSAEKVRLNQGFDLLERECCGLRDRWKSVRYNQPD